MHYIAARNFPDKTLKISKFQLSVTEVQLSAASEERDTLRDDLSNSGAGRDALIRKAWDVRDAAVKRKNSTQIELAKSRIDVMQVWRREKHISCLVNIAAASYSCFFGLFVFFVPCAFSFAAAAVVVATAIWFYMEMVMDCFLTKNHFTIHFLRSRSTPSSWSPSSRRLSSPSSLTSGRRTWRSCWRTRW